MPRSVRAKIETRSARLRLPPRREPYWHALEQGVAAGYYRPGKGGDGTWWGRVRINGRYVVEALATADDHADADGKRVLNWSQTQAAARTWASRQTQSGPLTVADAVRDYLDDLRARKGERAAAGAAGRLRKHLLPALGDRQVADLTDRDLRRWRNALVPATATNEEQIRRSRDTANRVLSIAKAVLNWAFKTGQVADDHAWRRVGPFENVSEARKVILSDTEIQRLVDACEPGLRELVAVGAQTGARLGELTNACVRDLDAEAGVLTVRGKTGRREVHVAPATVLLLRRAASGKRPDEILLPPADRPAWTHNLHTKRLAAAVARAGLDPATVFYSLRHSYISRALRNLIPPKVIGDACGTSLTMIERNYAKFITADRARYAELAAVDLRVDDNGAEVVQLKTMR